MGDTALNLFRQNCNILVSEELRKVENINKADSMGKDWIDIIKNEYHAALYEFLLMNQIK